MLVSLIASPRKQCQALAVFIFETFITAPPLAIHWIRIAVRLNCKYVNKIPNCPCFGLIFHLNVYSLLLLPFVVLTIFMGIFEIATTAISDTNLTFRTTLFYLQSEEMTHQHSCTDQKGQIRFQSRHHNVLFHFVYIVLIVSKVSKNNRKCAQERVRETKSSSEIRFQTLKTNFSYTNAADTKHNLD